MWNTRKALFLVCTILNLGTFAQTQDSTKTSTEYSGFVKMGFSGSQGNVNRSSSNYLLELNRKAKKAKSTIDLHFQKFINKGVKLDETFEVSVIHIHKMTKKSRLYLKTSAYKNIFRGFKQQWKEGIGYLHEFLDSEKSSISSRVGYQYRQNNVVGNYLDDYNNGDLHFVFFGQRSHFPVWEHVQLITQFDYEQDMNRSDNYYIGVESSLEMNVNKTLNVEFEYKYQYSGLPVTGRQHEDMTYKSSLVFRF